MIQSRNLTGQLFAVASLLVMGIVVVGCDLNGDSSNSNSSGSSNLDKDLRGEWTDDLATNASTLDMAFWQDTEDEDDDNKKKELLLALRDFWRDQPWDSGTETVTIDGNDFTRVAGTGTGTDGWFEQTSVTPNQDLYLNGLTGRFELYTQTNNWPTLIEGTFHLPTSTTITFTIHRSGDVSLNKSKSYLNTQWRVTNESWRYEMYPGPELQILGKTLLRDEPGLFGDTWSSADDTLQLAFLSDGTVEFIRQRLVGGKRAWAQLRVYDFVDEGGASGGWIRVAERLYADYDLNKDKDELTFYIDYPRVERRWSVMNRSSSGRATCR